MLDNPRPPVKTELAARLRGIFDNLVANIVANILGWLIIGLLAIVAVVFTAWFDENWWPYVLIYVVSLVLVAGLWLFDRSKLRQQIEDTRRALQTTLELAKLDETLLRLLSELVAALDKSASIRQLLVGFLLDATRLFAGDVSRASILVPDQEGLHLVRLASIEMPGDIEPEAPFYIGPDPFRKRGVAGEAFVSRKARIVHMDPTDQGHWVPDDPSYIESREKRHFPPYRSLVAVPILVADIDERATECLGVLCFDSMNRNLFDRPGQEDSLIILGRRIAAALALYRNLLPGN